MIFWIGGVEEREAFEESIKKMEMKPNRWKVLIDPYAFISTDTLKYRGFILSVEFFEEAFLVC